MTRLMIRVLCERNASFKRTENLYGRAPAEKAMFEDKAALQGAVQFAVMEGQFRTKAITFDRRN